ncbi:MAG: GMC family oxidoreductase [Deltaproteobacteria bacterium]|nr:GMC family oxidoreductase [Deltaproteobacteria bacterium]
METFQKEYDVIVVGSGPGGATVAKELTQRGEKVLILEWGDNAPVKGTYLQYLPQPGKSLLFTNGFLAIVRGIMTGGSSMIYFATAFDPPQETFKSYGIDISNEIEEIRNELPVAPLSDELTGPAAVRIMESARDLGYDWNKLPKFIYQNECRSKCHKCAFGCPYGAKWNARMFVEEAVEDGAQLINGAKVRKVLTENRKAVGVEYRKGGRTRKVFASKVILSAGGIGTPTILRESGNNRAGYDFFYDPLIFVMGTVKGIKGGNEIPMVGGVHMEEEGYLMTDNALPWPNHAQLAAMVGKFGKMFSTGKTLTIMVKAKDALSGRLTDKGGVKKALTEEDKRKLFKGYARAKDILENAGARDVFKSWYVAAHPGGTAKINEIVDSDLKTELENLYVCDCSVIPEAWGLPPTFSLLCLGKRLAKHLSGEKTSIIKQRENVWILKNSPN